MKTKTINLSTEETAALLDRVKSNSLSSADHEIIEALLETHILLQEAVVQKSSSIKKLLQMVFGQKTEKTVKPKSRPKTQKKKKKGHGRKSANEYTGAEKVDVHHTTLHHCDPCPDCLDGKIYRQTSPGVVIRITGTPPLQATLVH